MKTLLIATEQGGTGKTAVLRQFAHYLHRVRHLRVLVIDTSLAVLGKCPKTWRRHTQPVDTGFQTALVDLVADAT